MPKIYPWYAQDMPLIYPWYSHDMPMIYPSFTNYIPKIYLRYSHYPIYTKDIPKKYLWYPLDIPLNLLGPSGPLCTISNKNWFLLRSTSAKPYFFHFGQKDHFCLKWSKRAQIGPKGSQMVKSTWVDHFGSFWGVLDHFGTLTILPCLAIFGPKWTIFGPSPVMNSGK